ncbi:rod shape-determining protein RodA [Saccharophagus sp. K07]|jgi:rod shape determining protein RodA|uniref:rod shape-determining protein RodA n=1 Tax=Saccharophagus sp. K07 TaxID=2283636 RepID=UPI0016524CE9|nr:rod shape-determining protein RodA [Saccharophagus sp. K07]MBC6904451.1 rod shape-determining protein RodA [Saccharophagus sp. K07]
MSKGQDFVRRLPDSSHHFKSATSFWRLIHIDPILLLGLLALSVYGLVVLYSASGHSQFMVKRQVVFFGMAYLAMFAVAQVNLMFLERYAFWFYGFGIILLVLVLVVGVGAKGAQRWLSLGFVRFQPSEILKLAVPICVASFFSARILPPRFSHIVICLVFILLPAALIVKQPDLGTAILVATSGLIGLFLAGLPWRYILGTVAAVAAAAWPMWHFVMHDYQKRRVLTLLDPEADRLGAGWNIIQSKTAIGSGGWEGKGWMNGTQSQLDFLPESHTDFIIAVLAEEFGMMGVLLLLAGYFFVISRGLWIAVTAQSTFSRILAGSITLTFMVYVFVNIGMVSGLLPVVGVPLPLVSLGGTSLISLMLGFGLLMAVATERKRVTV